MRRVTGIARFLAHALLVIMAVATLGGLVPGIPVLGSIGSRLIAAYVPWITIISLVGAGLVFLCWRKTRKGRTLMLAIAAAFAVVGTTYIQSQQFDVAKANGIDINLVRTLWLGPPQHKSAPPEIQPYSSHDGQPLSLAIYRPATKKEAPMPIIVYVHGGGWGGGTLLDRADDMRWFADQGYLVFSIEYSLSSENKPTWDIAQPQIACGLAWIADHAAGLGGDAARLTLFGESAGGNLVLNVSYLANAGKLPSACGGDLPHIAATVASYPMLDAVHIYANDDLIAGPFARMMTTHYTSGTPEQFPDRYAAISPATHINPAGPPTLLLPGLADHLLTIEPAYEFVEKAKAAGIDARLIAFPYGEHSYDQRNNSIGSQFFRGATLQFLQQQGLQP